jgi:nucleotide-binding universal stress UspA family protein
MPKGHHKLRRPTPSAKALPWRRILVPLDFSKRSLRALDVAVRLARDCDGQLFLVSAIEPAVFTAGMDTVAMAVPDAALAKEAEENLPRIAKRFIPPGVPVTMLVERGRAFEVIAQVARKEKINLIVLTTHGRTGLNRFLMGSTAEQVVRRARCPVFVVRPSLITNKNHQDRKD